MISDWYDGLGGVYVGGFYILACFVSGIVYSLVLAIKKRTEGIVI